MVDAQRQLWEHAIPGQLAFALDDAKRRPASPTRRPGITAAGWAERAATGGLIVTLRDPTTGRHGVARWYALAKRQP